MNRLQLEELIEEKKQILSVPYQKDPAYSFFLDFVSHNPCTKMSDFLNIDIYELLKCLLYLKVGNLSIEDCSSKVNSFSSFLEDLNEEEMDSFLEFITDIRVEGKIQDFIQYLKETSHLKERFLLKRMYPGEKEAVDILLSFKESFANQLDEIIVLLNLIEEDIDLFVYLMQFVKTHKDALFVKRAVDTEISKCSYNLRAKESNKVLEQTLKDNFKVAELFKLIKPVYNLVPESDREEQNLKKNTEKEIRSYERALRLLDEASKKEEITLGRTIIKQIRDEEVKFAILQFIYDYNKAYYDRLEDEYQEISSNTKVKYQSLLHEFGIEIKNCNIEEIMHNKASEVETMVSYLKNKNFDNNSILDILRNTNFKVFEEVKGYMDKGYFSNAFAMNNREIFYSNSSILEVFRKNKSISEQYGVNPYVFRNYLELLFAEESKIEENLAVLANYGLLKSLKNTTDLSFLSNQNFILKIDQLLELGYEKLLEQDLSLLNYDNLKRLEVLRTLNFVLDSKSEVESVLRSDKFILPDDELDDYLPDVVSYTDLDTITIPEQSLDSFRVGQRTYNIGDNLISIYKVNRLLKDGNGLLQSITANRNLNATELNKLIEALGGEMKGAQIL